VKLVGERSLTTFHRRFRWLDKTVRHECVALARIMGMVICTDGILDGIEVES